MLVLALIIICIIIWTTKNKEIEKLTYENRKLKEKIKQYELGEIKISKEVKKIESKVKEVEKSVTVRPEQVVSKKPKVDDKEKKNITILVTGAICIVLAAIVFLISTWATIPNLLKTLVLVLLTVVFFVGSDIAQKKYNLPKASKVFYYIGMAYIPICLFSISIFKLFGEYLSFTGDGKNIYFVLSAIVTALIYYKNRKDKILLVGSILSQFLAIVAFSLIISSDIALIGVNLLLYNLLLMLITKDEIFKFAYKILPWIATVILIGNVQNMTVSLVVMQLALAANYLTLELKKSHVINAYMFNIVLVTTIVSIFDLLETKLTEVALHYGIIISTLFVHTIQSFVLPYKNNKNLMDASALTTGCTLAIIYIVNIFEEIVPLYVIGTAIFGVFTYYYMECKGGIKNVVEVILPSTFIITGLNILISLEATYHSYVLFAFVAYLINELLKEKLPTLYVKTNIISHLNLLITIIVSSIINGFSENVVYLIGLVLVYGYSYKSSKQDVFKYATYIMTNFMLYGLFTMFDGPFNPTYYIPMITTLAFVFIEFNQRKLKDVFSLIYTTLALFISFVAIYNMEIKTFPEFPGIIALVSGALIILFTKAKEYKIPHFMTIACMLPAILDSAYTESIRIVLVIASVAGLSFLSIKQNAWSIYTIASAIYLLGALTTLESIYLSEVIFLVWSVAHLLFVDKEYQQDIFKALTYIGGLVLYNTIVGDLDLTKYTLFALLGYLVAAIACFKTILPRYIKDKNSLNIFEYVVYGMIYLIALTGYADELDGIIFVTMLIAMIILSYIKKYNSLFITTSVAVIINIFLLTREFWFSIPWWLYLLVVGIVLIMFAINNEANGDKKKVTFKSLIKFIQEKVDEE